MRASTRAVALVGAAAVLLGVTAAWSMVSRAGAAGPGHSAQGHVSVSVSETPAFAGDAPDPDIVYSVGTYYAFTTGTKLGNHIQVLTSSSPSSGWGSYNGLSSKSSALP
ncbi:MAG: hypothetical protein ACRDYE_02635, partial [Acidimicrobiales bacterium]